MAAGVEEVLVDLEDLSIALLRTELRARGLDSKGKKKVDLVNRLTADLVANNIDPSAFPPKSPLTVRSLFGLQEAADDPRNQSGIAGSAEPQAQAKIDVPPPPMFVVDADKVAERWEKWIRSFGFYLEAMGNVPDNQQRSLFLHVAGADIQDIAATILTADDTYLTAVKKLKDHFSPKKHARFDRFLFKQASQRKDESTDNYVLRLRKLGESCEFYDLNDTILDQLIEKGYDSALRKKLLSDPDMTLDKALDLARAMEMTNKQMNVMEGRESLNFVHSSDRSRDASPSRTHRRSPSRSRRSPSPSGAARSSSRADNRQSNGRNCFRCGHSSHLASSPACPARKATCGSCKSVGHYARQCSKNKGSDKSRGSKEFVHHIRVNTVMGVLSKAMIPVELKPDLRFCRRSKTVLGLVDSGTNRTICPLTELDKLYPGASSHLSPSSVTLSGFSGEDIPVLGELSFVVHLKDREIKIPFLIVGKGQSILFGCDMISKLDLFKEISVNALDSTDHAPSQEIIPDIPSFPKIKGHVHKVMMKSNYKPVQQNMRTIPFSLREKISSEVKRLLELDIIEKVEASEWVSNLIVVSKPNSNKIRMCVDLRIPNRNIVVNKYPLPKINEVFHEFRDCKYFSQLDMKEGYFQLELHPESRNLTTFICPDGLYRYKRCCFGLASAVGAYQSMLQSVLKDIPGCTNFLDDIIIGGKTKEQHDSRLKTVLDRLKEKNFCINMEKSSFGLTEIDYLAHTIDVRGIRPSQKKVVALLASPNPVSFSEVETLIGGLGFWSRFIPKYTEKIQPVRDVLKKENFEWTSEAENATRIIKKAIAVSFLSLYDPDKELYLACDASNIGVGSCLYQLNEDNSWRVIEFFSKKFTEAEKKFSVIEKESYAIVLSCEKFRNYLLGRSFVIETDHSPIKFLFANQGMDRASLRISRWLLRLLPFVFEIKYKRGVENLVPDFLSRFPVENHDVVMNIDEHEWVNAVFDTPALKKDEFLSAINSDEDYLKLISLIENNVESKNEWNPIFLRFRDEYSIIDGFVLRGEKLVLPEKMRKSIMKIAHETHLGIVKMKQNIRALYWWPKMDDEIEAFVKECSICNALPKSLKPVVIPFKNVELPLHPWEKVAIDIKGPDNNKTENRFAIVVIDYFSKFPFVKLTKNVTTRTVISFVKEIFAVEGICPTIVTDNGVQFQSSEWKSFCEENNIAHVKSSLYYPQGNSIVERFNRSLSDTFEAFKIQNEGNFVEYVQKFLQCFRSTPHCSTGFSPSFLLHGREISTKLSLSLPSRKKEKRVTFADDSPSNECPFEVDSSVRFFHPRLRKVVFGKVSKIISPECVELNNGQRWNVRKLSLSK